MNEEYKRSLILLLRICILISLIIFLITFNTIPKIDCEACEFKLNDKDLNFEEFMKIYFSKCVYPFKEERLNINFSEYNISE
jgi:hypothetical protein